MRIRKKIWLAVAFALLVYCGLWTVQTYMSSKTSYQFHRELLSNEQIKGKIYIPGLKFDLENAQDNETLRQLLLNHCEFSFFARYSYQATISFYGALVQPSSNRDFMIELSEDGTILCVNPPRTRKVGTYYLRADAQVLEFFKYLEEKAEKSIELREEEGYPVLT